MAKFFVSFEIDYSGFTPPGYEPGNTIIEVPAGISGEKLVDYLKEIVNKEAQKRHLGVRGGILMGFTAL